MNKAFFVCLLPSDLTQIEKIIGKVQLIYLNLEVTCGLEYPVPPSPTLGPGVTLLLLKLIGAGVVLAYLKKLPLCIFNCCLS